MVRKFYIIICVFIFITSFDSFSGTVIKKEEASLYSKKSDYATLIEQNSYYESSADSDMMTIDELSEGVSNNSRASVQEDDLDRFKATKATKNGNKYTNIWSDYNITISDKNNYAAEYYDFTDSSTVFDFGVYFRDYSRLAVYYSLLSRPLDQVAQTFSKTFVPNDVIIAGNVFKHVRDEVSYPFGVDYYDYYFRDIDGKLMVIECFCENNDNGIASSYIDKFMKNS